MENKLKRFIENLEERETLTLGDQTFSNEMILDESIQLRSQRRLKCLLSHFQRISSIVSRNIFELYSIFCFNQIMLSSGFLLLVI
jgi:hypothetical protein